MATLIGNCAGAYQLAKKQARRADLASKPNAVPEQPTFAEIKMQRYLQTPFARYSRWLDEQDAIRNRAKRG